MLGWYVNVLALYSFLKKFNSFVTDSGKKNCIYENKKKKKWFKITCVHRDDLIAIGFDGDAVDDATMERLANKMADDYVTQLFWCHLEIIAEYLEIPLLKETSE